jgi:glucose dehydrogenase
MSGAFMDGRGSRWIGALLMLVGAGMTVGGLELAMAGGSFYCLPAGATMVVSGALVFRCRREGAVVYLLLIFVTLAWAFTEVGFRFWQLVSRLDVVLGLGVLFLIPGVIGPARPLPVVSKAPRQLPRMRLPGESPHRPAMIASGGAVVFIAALSPMAPHTETAAADVGAAALSKIAAAGADWTRYGGPLADDRYSALDQLTPANVGQLQIAWIYHTGEWQQPDDPLRSASDAECPRRILEATADARLIAVNADTGKACLGFGTQGEFAVDLKPFLSP